MAANLITGFDATESDRENFTIHEEACEDFHRPMPTVHGDTSMGLHASSIPPTPLTTSKLENVQHQNKPQNQPDSLAKLAGSALVAKKPKNDQGQGTQKREVHPSSMDSLLTKLSEQQALLSTQKAAVSLAANEDQPCQSSLENSAATPPTSDSRRISNVATADGDTERTEEAELTRLKMELVAAKNEILRQQQEISRSRNMKHTIENSIQTPSEANLSPTTERMSETFDMPHVMSESNRQSWIPSEDTRSESPVHEGSPSMWNSRATYNSAFQSDNALTAFGGRLWNARGGRNTTVPNVLIGPPNDFSNPHSPHSGTRAMNDYGPLSRNDFGQLHQQGGRRGRGFDTYNGIPNQLNNVNIGNLNSGSPYQALGLYAPSHQPQPIGTPLSPMAAEFQTASAQNNPWNVGLPASPGQTYVSPMEPLNYRRLLDRNVTCNWKYIVDKIVCNNDQQASIFLQQKLKIGTAEQKYEIIEAIVAQAYPLMVNRFGNFLVQRCFEHGTPEQVIAIANAIRGNTLSLSMDPFGCHVVQKAFDAVPEDYKAIMVHELLRRIPETVIHRYACHVWQKLFELRWSDSPPQIMKYVNEALRGMWHEVALGETGSLVVQNIFENCLEEDKRPCIDEVLQSIDIVAHGQFGNWCIQHICEHGLPADRSRAIDHVLRYATEYSMDQFASKVVEKCLKIGGSEFLERYLERVCEGRADRPRIPLIDIASDQYGNYLIQFILTHASPNHREVVGSHIRKHMVSLRGSKFGSRVGMLCCNPAYTTHPGPGVGMGLPASSNRFSSAPAISRYGSGYR